MILTGIIFLFTNCNDVLDRPSLTTSEDDAYWTSEDRVRLYANAFYTNFFVGYGLKYETTYAPNANYTFNDDAVRLSTQTQFGRTVPTSKGSTSLDMMWQSEFTGPTWNFAWIRKANVMLDRVSARMKDILTEEQYNHWMGIGRFFRGMEYARLVNVFGDVPYYDTEVLNTDKDALYKDRTPRNEVMDAVYDDFDFAMKNVRLDDGDAQYVNRYVVAAFVSRWALFEASWQKYYYKNDERAKKFFEQAIAAADLVMSSGKYDIVTDFRSLFGSTKSTKDCILYRTYDADKGVTHSIASTCNMNDPTDVGPNLDLIKAFICTDGKDWQTSAVANAADFTLSNLIKTRDARFEASFYNKPTPRAKSCYLYVTKFIPRSALEYIEKGGSPAPEFQGEKNVTGYPVIRYAEVLLNWIEAKAELATLGGPAVVQTDIDESINKIRNRPIAEEAKADLFEIEPKVPYTKADLDWMNKKSRSSVEMSDKKYRPAIMKKEMDMSSYDEILLGFPIWWYVAPTIINTFLEAYDFSGKKIVLFATSGGSGFGNTVKELQSSAPDAVITEGRLLNCGTKQEISEWVNSL